jgi:hypothetical protein
LGLRAMCHVAAVGGPEGGCGGTLALTPVLTHYTQMDLQYT